ncbi:MAG: hypothetical protein PUP93_15560, partial [Rhizonema sp. NSF051]|nr:hypothetical protein [Rhizonema sp. NSF051]
DARSDAPPSLTLTLSLPLRRSPVAYRGKAVIRAGLTASREGRQSTARSGVSFFDIKVNFPDMRLIIIDLFRFYFLKVL